VSDKHRVLAAGALGILPPDIQQGRFWGVTILKGSCAISVISLFLPLPVIEDDADFLRIGFASMTPDFEMKMKDDFAAIELRFGEAGKLSNFSVTLDQLADMGDFVQHVVDKFDPSPPERDFIVED